MENNDPIFLEEDQIAAMIAAAKAEVKTELRSEFKNTEPTPNYDADTLTVYFFNGSFIGVGAGLLEGEEFLKWNEEPSSLIKNFFESDEFSIIEENYRDKNGNVCYDTNNQPIKQYKTKLYSHPFMHGKGVTAGGDEYEYFSIGRHGATIAGYSTHFAFSSPRAGQEDVFKNYILIDTYQASKVVDKDGITHIGSFRHGYPIGEIGEPQNVVHPYRGYQEQGMRFEMQWLDILEAIVMGRRGEGYYGAPSLELANHFCGDALDINGASFTADAGEVNSFSVANTSAYAEMAVGAEVSFHTSTNVYDARTGANVVTRTITAKATDGTNTTFTFDGDAIEISGKRIRTSYFARTGVTDSIDEDVWCGYRTEYPKGYQPFKLFNVEKPWGAHATWLDWLKWNNSGNIQICQTTADGTVDNYAWNNFYFPGMATGANYVKEMKDYGTVRVLLPSSVYSGDSVTYYGVRQYWHGGNNYAIVHGRAYQNADYKYGGQFFLSSCCNSGWSYVASGYLNNGCWGRPFRSVR